MNRSVLLTAALMVAATLPASAAPLAGLSDLAGTWKCAYRAGTTHLEYTATWTYDRAAGTMRQVDAFAGGGGAEELVAYDAKHRVWFVVVFDSLGTATVMRGKGGSANHYAYRSVFPDASIGVRFDRTSSSEYTLDARVGSGTKASVSVDSCSRSAP